MQRVGWSVKLVAVLAALMMTLASAGCGSEGPAPQAMSQGDMPQPASGDEYGEALPQDDGDGDAGADERMVIRTKTLRLEVESTADALDKVRDLTGTYKGTVSTMEVATNNDDWVYRYDETGDTTALRGWITVRVPSDQYEAFVEKVSEVGLVKFQTEASSDVTQEYVDLSARLENLRAQEVRLREFFDAAKDVKDMLDIETELGRVRGDIESLDAQVKYLERQAAMATITVELTEPESVVRPGGESWGFVEAITDGFRGAAGLLAGLLTFIIATSPLWIAALVLFFPIRALIRRRKSRVAHKSSARKPTPPGKQVTGDDTPES